MFYLYKYIYVHAFPNYPIYIYSESLLEIFCL